MTRVSDGHIDNERCAVVDLCNLFHGRKPVHSGAHIEGHHEHQIVTREEEEPSVKPAVQKRGSGNRLGENNNM